MFLPQTATALLPELARIGITVGGALKVAMMPLGYDDAILKQYGSVLAGVTVYSTTKPFEINDKGQEVFLKAMSDYAPEIQPATVDSAVEGWLSADLFLRGLREAGACPTRQSFITQLRKVTNYDGAQMTADNNVDLSTNYTQPSTCNFFTKFPPAGGTRFLPQNFGQPYCGKPISPAQEAALNH